jgi:hypothetical protein
MAHLPYRKTATELRAEAAAFRAAAAKNASHPETAASYLRLAKRLEQLAEQRDAEDEVR